MPDIQISYVVEMPPSVSKNNEENDRLMRTFVLNVDKDAYDELLHTIKDGHPQDLTLKRNQFEILTFHEDSAASLEPATPHDLWHAFGHKDEYHVAYIIAQKGHLEGSFPKPNELHNELFA